ncbi:MAG: hypothetical protein JOZ18_07970 [Chloroflexi bacterium]|nr:hypothetical protein [Chloroflexota bacterium]
MMFLCNGGNTYQLSKLLRYRSVKVTESYLKALSQAEARQGAKLVLVLPAWIRPSQRLVGYFACKVASIE